MKGAYVMNLGLVPYEEAWELQRSLALAEQRVLAHDEARRIERSRAVAETISPGELARDDAFRRAMRAARVELVECVERAAEVREQRASVREQSRLVLAESRARALTIA